MNTKNLAIIGCTDILYNYVFNGFKNLPIEVKAISSSNEKNIERFSRIYARGKVYLDYHEMLRIEKPDIVVSFPDDDDMQFEAARDSLKSGAWVFSERPISDSIKEIDELIQLQKETGRFIIPRYNRRYMPAYVLAKETLAQGKLGSNRIYYNKFHASAYGTEKLFIWNHMSHLLDLARFILGEITITHLQRTFISDSYIVYDITIMSEDGCIGTIQACSTACNNYPIERMELHGDINSLIIDNQLDLQYNREIENKFSIENMNLNEKQFCLRWKPNTNHLFNYSIDGMENLFIHMLNCMKIQIKPKQEMEDLKQTLLLTKRLEQLAQGLGESYE